MSDTMKRMWTERQIRGMAVDSVENKEDLKVFDHIVDKDGHPRFVEGDITISEVTGITQSYGKWSLSGSHLMMVAVISLAVGSYTATDLATLNIPSWIKDKIELVNPDLYWVDNKNFLGWTSGGVGKSVPVTLTKADDTIKIRLGTLSVETEAYVRIQFDLLIDNE